MSLYKLSGIKKIFAQRVVLDIPDLALDDGAIYALLGANGAGKTTLLNILSFLERPSEGNVVFQNDRVNYVEKELKYLRRKVALVDQKPLLFSTTVYKNLEFGLKIRKVPKAKRAQLISQALELVGMRQFQDKSAVHLSGGEIQRVALARAFVLEPKVLLCDEPTANVDSANQLVVVDLLRKINAARGIAIVFTTHDSSLALNLAQKTIHLSQGQIVTSRIENSFSANIQQREDGKYTCIMPSGLGLEMGGFPADTGLGQNCLVTIDPWKIEAVQKTDIVRGGNKLQGKIVKIELEKNRVRLVFDSGELFTVMMTKEKYAKMKILAGDELCFSVLPEAVHFVSLNR